jgi:hypothetical protein
MPQRRSTVAFSGCGQTGLSPQTRSLGVNPKNFMSKGGACEIAVLQQEAEQPQKRTFWTDVFLLRCFRARL